MAYAAAHELRTALARHRGLNHRKSREDEVTERSDQRVAGSPRESGTAPFRVRRRLVLLSVEGRDRLLAYREGRSGSCTAAERDGGRRIDGNRAWA
jgi:hypothetical protein